MNWQSAFCTTTPYQPQYNNPIACIQQQNVLCCCLQAIAVHKQLLQAITGCLHHMGHSGGYIACMVSITYAPPHACALPNARRLPCAHLPNARRPSCAHLPIPCAIPCQAPLTLLPLLTLSLVPYLALLGPLTCPHAHNHGAPMSWLYLCSLTETDRAHTCCKWLEWAETFVIMGCTWPCWLYKKERFRLAQNLTSFFLPACLQLLSNVQSTPVTLEGQSSGMYCPYPRISPELSLFSLIT